MIEMKNVTLSYKNNMEVLKDISLSVAKGESVLFTGESGSGKSSIINSINGLSVKYDGGIMGGETTISGKPVKNLELYEIAMLISNVFQNPKTHFFNVNTTIELLFYLENIGLSREEMDKRMKDMLEIFPIEHLLNKDIFKLSGGEKQILCIAASYIAGTETVVLDEPSSNLDNKNIDIVTEMLMKLKNKGITLIISEHRIFYLMDIVDKIFLVKDGKIQGEYTKQDFLKLSKKELNDMGLRDKLKSELKVPVMEKRGNLEIRRLEVNFADTKRKMAIEDVYFQTGNIYGIVGANGIGKSTFVRSLIGVEKKSKDEIYFDGKKLSKKERVRNSALVMQDVNHQLFTDDVTEEVGLGIKNVDGKQAEDILRKLDLYKFKDAHPMSLSGGQKQRVAIASVLCKNPGFIFFDEPTSGMDYTNMKRIATLINEFRREDKIIFIVSHDIEFLNLTADYVMRLDN